MNDLNYVIELSSNAEQDYENLILWLQENRSLDYAFKIEARISTVFATLSASPYQWQRVNINGLEVRRALINEKYIILYRIYPDLQVVHMLAIRGAAEDWTNQPLPSD